MADANPTVTTFQADLAVSHNNIGNLQVKTGHPDDAMWSFTRSLAIRQRLANANPHRVRVSGPTGHDPLQYRPPAKPDWTFEGTRCGRNCAALAILQELANADPAVTEFQNDLAAILGSIGALYRATGRSTEAMRSLKAALVILEKFDSPDRENLYNRACFLAAISALTGTDEERDEAGDRAMKALPGRSRPDIVTGTTSPKTPTSTALRSRPDFQLLMLDLVFPPDPFSR